MNKSTYGNSLENVRSRIYFILVNNKIQLIKRTTNPRLKICSRTIKKAYHAGLAMKTLSIFLNSPLYVGFIELDISKLTIYIGIILNCVRLIQIHYSTV